MYEAKTNRKVNRAILLVAYSLFMVVVLTHPLIAEEGRPDTSKSLAERGAGSDWPNDSKTIPFLLLDEEDSLILTEALVDSKWLTQKFFGGACNGGSCAAAGVPLNCPTSGGPECSENESCTCKCKEEEGSVYTVNECVDEFDLEE